LVVVEYWSDGQRPHVAESFAVVAGTSSVPGWHAPPAHAAKLSM